MNSFKNTDSVQIDNFNIEANINNPNEYFAQSFSCFLVYPEQLANNCPNTYSYIENYMIYLKQNFSNYTKKRTK